LVGTLPLPACTQVPDALQHQAGNDCLAVLGKWVNPLLQLHFEQNAEDRLPVPAVNRSGKSVHKAFGVRVVVEREMVVDILSLNRAC
jgi:hypothetical protein